MSEHTSTQTIKGGVPGPKLGQKRMDVRKLATLAILSAIAFAVMVVGRIPIVLFLKYDPKDVVIAITGFIYGPLSAVMVSVVVSFFEMITVSDTGPWGLVMNILSTCAFVCPAAYIYSRRRTMKSAVIGIIVGAVIVIPVMMLWNYLVVPIYMGYPREAVADLLLPYFLPFNVLKAGLNATLTILLYKPVVKALRKARLVPETGSGSPEAQEQQTKKRGVAIVAFVVFLTLVMFGLVLAKVI